MSLEIEIRKQGYQTQNFFLKFIMSQSNENLLILQKLIKKFYLGSVV